MTSVCNIIDQEIEKLKELRKVFNCKGEMKCQIMQC